VVPRWAWSSLGSLVDAVPDRLVHQGRKRRLGELDQLWAAPFGHYYYASQVYLSDKEKRERVLATGPNGVTDTASYLQNLYESSGATNVRDGVAYVDFRTQLPEEFLMMTDRFSMAHSLEARVPFLDRQFIELVFSIPSSLRTKAGDTKYLLKAALSGLLPDRVAAVRKRGFVIPVKLWLRGAVRPLAERLLSADRLREQGIFNPGFAESFLRPHIEGKADYTWQVWAALMFQLWHLIFIEEGAVSRPTFNWKDLV
jgi:asparagine synthase (glutamine-hydrolysing)